MLVRTSVPLFLFLCVVGACGPADRNTAGVDGGARDDGGDSGSCATDDRVCVAGDVHACNADGTTGDLVESCPGTCSRGECTSSCGAEGVDKVYVVGSDYRLMRFDPTVLPASGSADGAFSIIGQLDCPAGAPIDGSVGVATPFSMAVDREGQAWVLYSSGEIFHVSISDASCAATGFVPGQGDFELFGMGFASDAEGSAAETLYIAGGAASQIGEIGLGKLDTETKTVTPIGALPASTVGPELTGTGAAELWGYFPGGGFDETRVGRIDKVTGEVDGDVPMEPLAGTPRAWAFAQHGGKFYVFVTYSDFDLSDVPAVQVVDPTTGDVETHFTNNIIVGAGVSTCAPSGPVE